MRILVVDDDKNITKFLKNALEEECFEVDLANDGDRGSYLGRVNEYDLIVLDYALPEKDGKTVCKELRENNQNAPILMLSVQSDPLTKAGLINAGADDYMTKPFSFEELLARVKALLRRPKEIKSEILQIDNLVIDTKAHTAKRGDNIISLTSKEFMLLEYLVLNKNCVVSRAKIIEHVWDMNGDIFSNTIEAHISNIRKKIDMPNEKPLIKSVSGRGYLIQE